MDIKEISESAKKMNERRMEVTTPEQRSEWARKSSEKQFFGMTKEERGEEMRRRVMFRWKAKP